jgi:carboxypeptidase Taq
LHEIGHALYEQGLNKELVGLPVGQAVSLGIHESQSRLWENHVGRSFPFWCFWHAAAIKHLPDLARYSPSDLAGGVQRVAPSFSESKPMKSHMTFTFCSGLELSWSSSKVD